MCSTGHGLHEYSDTEQNTVGARHFNERGDVINEYCANGGEASLLTISDFCLSIMNDT